MIVTNVSDKWFAWRPVKLANGRLSWLRVVWRTKVLGVTLYFPYGIMAKTGESYVR